MSLGGRSRWSGGSGRRAPKADESRLKAALALAVGLLAGLGAPAAGATPPQPSQVVLVTLDTTRSDALGSYAGRDRGTPVLDGLAARGVRYARALTPCPLTLPAHASMMTGLRPPEHGVRDNGAAALPPDIPTLAEWLARRDYATGAFVASGVLDGRFGLDRGFGIYDDQMAEERTGEYGYAERRAESVVAEALAWVARLPRGQPFFLWVHLYDPHAPYSPPGRWAGRSDAERYAGEVAYMDGQIGRLLDGLPGDDADRLVAVVGDHGEMLGEHGERAHGFFLYRSSLEVPFILAGPGVAAGGVVAEVVSSRRLAATLLRLLGDTETPFGAPLPVGAGEEASPPVYSETWLPATAYGWAALRAVSDQRYRYIQAPRPELYDLLADPGETRDLSSARPDVAARLSATLEELQGHSAREASPLLPDEEMAEMLESLGYLSGATSPGLQEGTLDPKDGIRLAREYEVAREALQAGRGEDARRELERLVQLSPRSVPFLTAHAAALQATGDGEGALRSLRRAVELNPGNDLLQRRLGDAHLDAGHLEQARAQYERVLELNPRSARAWLGLADIAHRRGDTSEERGTLGRALAAGTRSALILTRVGQMELETGELSSAEGHLEEATRLVPELASAWWVWGEVAEAAGHREVAAARLARAIAGAAEDPAALRHLARLLGELGRDGEARVYLDRATALERERRLPSGD